MRDLMASGRASMVTYGAIRAIAAGAASGWLSHDGSWAGHTQFWHNEYRMIGYEHNR